jgi:serine/threonine protein kinase
MSLFRPSHPQSMTFDRVPLKIKSKQALLNKRGIYMQKTPIQYHLRRELARKHSHITYLASLANEPKCHIVVTMFTLSLLGDPDERERMLLKAKRIGELKHHYLTPILDIRVEEEQLLVVREYLPHGSLRGRLKPLSSGRLELRDALTIISQVGQALQYAHEHYVTHGNIKPENILFDANDQAFLTDFNLVSANDTAIRDHIAEEYAFCYMAPEQFADIGNPKSDQYALGCLAYELITGHLPFATESLASMRGNHTSEQPVPLSSHVAGLSPSLEAAVLKAMAKDPSDRYPTIYAFLEAMDEDMLPSTPLFPFHSYTTYSTKKRTPSGPLRPLQVQQSDIQAAMQLDLLLANGNEPLKLSQNSLLTAGEIEDMVTSHVMKAHEAAAPALHPAWFAAETVTVPSNQAVDADQVLIVQPPDARRRSLSPLKWVLVLSVISVLIFFVFRSSGLSLPASSSLYIMPKAGVVTRISLTQTRVPLLTLFPVQPSSSSLPLSSQPPSPSPLSAQPSPAQTSSSSSTDVVAPAIQPSLAGSFAEQGSQVYNLTTEGTLDWVDWGLNTAQDVNRKRGVPEQVSTFTLIGNGTVQRDDQYSNTYIWSDGTPVAVEDPPPNQAVYGIDVVGLNNGFRISVQASTTARTLRLYIGTKLARGQLTATLDGQTYTDSSLDTSSDPHNTQDNGIYTLTFNGSLPGQVLTVTYTAVLTNGSDAATFLQAATLH